MAFYGLAWACGNLYRFSGACVRLRRVVKIGIVEFSGTRHPSKSSWRAKSPARPRCGRERLNERHSCSKSK